jgi:5-methylcytosine-specific restriction protein A
MYRARWRGGRQLSPCWRPHNESKHMPSRAPRICSCGRIVTSGALCECQRARAREADRRRPSARQRGYDSQWEAARTAFLAQPEHRYCACGCNRYADTIHHNPPHRGDMRKFWDRSTWVPMAFECHSKIKEDKRPRGESRGLPKGPRTAWGRQLEINSNSALGNLGARS